MRLKPSAKDAKGRESRAKTWAMPAREGDDQIIQSPPSSPRRSSFLRRGRMMEAWSPW